MTHHVTCSRVRTVFFVLFGICLAEEADFKCRFSWGRVLGVVGIYFCLAREYGHAVQ